MRVALVAAAAGLLAGCGGSEAGAEATREILLVSGRDEHGLVAQERVALAPEPEAAARPGDPTVAGGTLVRVVAARGEWTRVRSLEGPRAEGWVNDYHLRGVVHVCAAALPRSAQAEILSVGDGGIRVRTVEGARVAVVPRRTISELPC